MSEQDADMAAARIDRALARIEAAARTATLERADLERRHAELRVQIAAAIEALDSLIAQEAEEDAG